jgi:uncharacterized protein (DUF1697 family)
VLLKGANVGGHRKFAPAALAKEMADFGVENVGAAGTFVIRTTRGEAAFRAALAKKLPFTTEVMIFPARDLVALAESEPFPQDPPGDDVRRMVSVLVRKPAARPHLPIRRPEGKDWQVEVFAASGRFVLSFWRPDRENLIYLDVVEKEFGVPATTRTWNTVEKIRKILQRG